MTNAGSIHQENRWSPLCRSGRLVSLAVIALIAAVSHITPAEGRSTAQNPAAGQDQPQLTWGIVTSETLTVRNGRNAGYDEIARLEQGDFVQVRTFNQFGWATITVPEGTIGFIEVKNVYDAEQADTVIAANRAKLYYPTENDPLKIWKSVYVDAGTKLSVQEIHATPNGDYYSVLMPDWVDAYVPSQFIREATAEEVAAHLATLAQKSDPPADPGTDEAGNGPAETQPPADNDTQAQPEESTTETDKQAATAEDDVPSDVVDQDGTDEAPADEAAATQDGDDSNGGLVVEFNDPDPQEVAEYMEAVLEEAARAERQEAWDNLEGQYATLLKTPIREAEIEPLIDGYLSLATNPDVESGMQPRASMRVQLLTIRLQYQQAQRELDLAIRKASRMDEADADGSSTLRSRYDAVGVVTSSNIYTGLLLPRLYRIVDPDSGRTVAYFDPARLPADFTAQQVLGRTVGITGTARQEAALSVQVTKIDTLTILPNQ